MAIERWSPFREFLNLQTEMDRAMRRALHGELRPAHAAWTPSLESYARGDDLVVKLDVPGIDPEQVDISVKENELVISGERRQTEKIKEENYYIEECSYGAFERTMTLPKESRADDIKATYKNGVLEIVVPQGAKVSEARKVAIEAE